MASGRLVWLGNPHQAQHHATDVPHHDLPQGGSGATALYGCRNGELVTDPDKYQHMAALCEEMDTLCNAKGLTLFDTPILEQAVAVATATGTNYSSMLQDVRQQRRTELDFITGYLLKIAAEQGLNLPQNQSLYKTLTTDCKP